MIGRATRRCDEIGKELFRIFDAVDIYANLQAVTDMRPVVVDASLPLRPSSLIILERARPTRTASSCATRSSCSLRRAIRHFSEPQREALLTAPRT